jgi:hypothetical protein
MGDASRGGGSGIGHCDGAGVRRGADGATTEEEESRRERGHWGRARW